LSTRARVYHIGSFDVIVKTGWPAGQPAKYKVICTVLALAGGAAFAASWFVGQVTGGGGQNVAVAAGWERATLK
jgi:hypothetical protein